jgi:predicted lipoprotein with Yx(FWY)xxD motif
MIRLTLVVSAMAFLSCLAFAKRIASAPVEPVIHEGVRYIAPNDDGRRGYIEAWDVQTNKKLWDLTVFTNRIDPKLEEDVQWVFIKALMVENGVLLVTSESERKYQVDLTTKAIKEWEPVLAEASPAIAQHDDIPEVVRKALAKGSLAKEYEVLFQLKPFYPPGDFNGDGKTDIAVLVKQCSTGKLGIAIIHGETDKVAILGAGTAIGNGGDDFE